VSRPLSTSAAKEHSGTSFKGVFPIMATPFNPDETLDVPGFAKALKFMADAGANGMCWRGRGTAASRRTPQHAAIVRLRMNGRAANAVERASERASERARKRERERARERERESEEDVNTNQGVGAASS